VDFVAFIAMVINGTAKVERRSRKIDIMVNAAERLQGLKDFSAEELHGILSQAVPPSQVLEPNMEDLEEEVVLFW
jgi:hypothetical protein